MRDKISGPRADLSGEIARSQALTARFAGRTQALKQASRKISGDASRKLEWVAAFVAEDPLSWHPGEAAACGDCLLALIGWKLPENFVGGVELPDELTLDVVSSVHERLKQFLTQLVSVKEMTAVSIPSEGLDLAIGRATSYGQRPAIWYPIVRSTTVEAGVLSVVRDLVLSHRNGNLVACEFCGQPIFARHKRRHCPGPTGGCRQKKASLEKSDKRAALKEALTPKMTPKRPDAPGLGRNARTRVAQKPA